MRLRTFGVATVLAAALFQPTGAVVRPKGAEAPFVAAERGARTHRNVEWSSLRRGGALANRLAADGLAGWTAQWDRDTEVPLRMWSSGIVHTGSVAQPLIAEQAARDFLRQHIATLAPGASASDFELVANELNPSGTTRTVGFVQRSNGVRVLGGGLGFAFKADRLVMVSSTALPNVAVAVPRSRLSVASSRQSAVDWLAQDGYTVAPKDRATEQVIIPLVRPKKNGLNIDYRIAEQLEVDSVGEPGTWVVWVDAASGAPIARKSGIRYASGRVLFDVPDRHPAGTRSPKPAPFARYTIGAETVTATADGTITWTGTTGVNVQLTPAGQFVSVINRGGSPRVTEMVSLAAGGQFNWSLATEEFEDAQISSYVYANQAKTFVRERLNPNLGWLNATLAVAVNENSSCNAYSTGDDIHFFRRGQGCENTGRLSDVVYHEFGHSLHANSIINGVGDFDGALSEGIGDTLAMAMTHDSGMGRGFFMSNSPLRQLNPATDKVWGVHTTGEAHDDGEIYGGTMWDLKVALEESLGTEAGYDKFLEIFYATVQRASDVPSSYAEALLADDDDGNLDNGTPNKCAIDRVFAAHGLADLNEVIGLQFPVRDGNRITIAKPTPPNASCSLPTLASAQIEWFKRGDSNPPQLIVMEETAEGLAANLPEASDGSVANYRITMTLTDSNRLRFPNNPAEEFYQYYVGPVTPIKCFDFEDGPQGWTNTADWQVGAPEGLGGDPTEAYSGTNVFGIDLSNDGKYRNGTTAVAESPDIDLGGATQVRLQYRRHLAVEDGVFDNARILVNGTEVWKNFTSPGENGSTHHIDKEWIFQDIDLSQQAASGKVKLRFELDADQGLNFGGWTIDDVCVVRLGEDVEVAEDEPGGCCSSSGGPAGSLLLGLGVLGLVIRRRRR